MDSLDSRAKKALRKILKGNPKAVREHTAVHYVGSFEEEKERRIAEGCVVIREKPGELIFMQHKTDPSLRLEIISPDWLCHEAWAVPTIEDYLDLELDFDACSGFQLIEDETIETDDLLAKMYRYCGTRHQEDDSEEKVYQIIWRKNQTFTDVFPD